MPLCSALILAPFWVLIAALALEALMVPLPGLLFREKANLLAQLFPFILNAACARCGRLLCFIFVPGRDGFSFLYE